MSNLQPNCCLKFDFQKVDQHVGGKWLIHDTKRRQDNQLIEGYIGHREHSSATQKDSMGHFHRQHWIQSTWSYIQWVILPMTITILLRMQTLIASEIMNLTMYTKNEILDLHVS